MTGRGKPRKARSPETDCAKSKTSPEVMNQVLQCRCRVEEFLEEKHNGARKEQKLKETDQKKLNDTKKKPSVRSTRKEATTKHGTEETPKPRRTPKDTTQAPVQGRAAKISAGKAKSRGQSKEETTNMLPETPKDMTKDSPKTTKAKRRGEGAKSPVQFTEKPKMQQETPMDTTKGRAAKTSAGKAKSRGQSKEETTNMLPETPKDMTKDSPKTTKAKRRGEGAKSPVQFTEKPKMQQETPMDTTKVEVDTTITQQEQKTTTASTKKKKAKACAGKTKLPDKFTEETVNTILDTTLKKLKIKKDDRANAAEVINDIIKHIIKHLQQNSECFQEVGEPLRTGSYYENVKISDPDEFDVMLPIPVERAKVEPFGENGAFYSVELKRGNKHLQKFQKDSSTLSASKMLEEFREEVKKCVKPFKEWEVTKKKKGCPAVTLTTTVQSVTISLDVVLCLMVKSSWPTFTNKGLQIENWLGSKVKQDFKRKPYYLVPKYEGRGNVINDGVLVKDVWRVSFSHIEKAILKNHGSEKTCCEKNGERCCRKDCLKLLKHLLGLLKENDSFDKFCSYHAKTTLLHACCSRTKDSEWRASSLSRCFQLLLEDFAGHLEKGELHNFFIPSQNLLSGVNQKTCNLLAGCIREEYDKGFPIFK